MTKNGIVLSVIAVILAVVYAIFFTDWFRTDTIQIIPQVRPGRASAIPRQRDQPPVYPVSFAFDGKYKFTSLKVVSADEYVTNKRAEPLWHMISDSNSVPTKVVVYGMPIKGMKPSAPRARPQPLQPDTPYLLFIEAGKVKGQTNFMTREYVPLNGSSPPARR